MHRLASTLLAAVLVSPGAAWAAAEDDGLGALAAASLQPQPDLDALRAALSAPGAGITTLVPVLLEGWVPLVPPLKAARPLRADLREVLLAALADASPGAWRLSLDELAAEGAGPAPRAAALELLGHAGLDRDLTLFFALAAPEGEDNPPHEVARATRFAAATWVRRTPDVAAALVRDREDRPTAIAVALIDALGDAAVPEALDVLVRMVREGDELLLPALAAIGRCAAGLPASATGDARREARDYLTHRDPFVAAQAAVAAGALRDEEAIPALIDILATEGHVGVANAARALKAIAGVDYRRSARAWRSWHADELRRWDVDAHRAMESLGAADASEVKRAIRTLATGRLFRRERAEALLSVLSSPRHDVVRLACSALACLGSSDAVPALIDLLQDANVGSSAHDALRTITGLDLPPEGDVWKDALTPNRES